MVLGLDSGTQLARDQNSTKEARLTDRGEKRESV